MEQEKLKNFKIEFKNLLEFSNKLNNIFQYEFDNLLSEILCLPEKNFFEKLKTEINKILTNLFSTILCVHYKKIYICTRI